MVARELTMKLASVEIFREPAMTLALPLTTIASNVYIYLYAYIIA